MTRIQVLLALSLNLFFLSLSYGQSTWEASFSKPDHNYKDYSITKAKDGSNDLLLAGTLWDQVVDRYYVHVIRIDDTDGATVFEKTYDTGDNDWAMSVTAFQIAGSTGYAITGFTGVGNIRRTMVFTIDETGVVLQKRSFEQGPSATFRGIGLHIEATPNAVEKGFVLVGTIHDDPTTVSNFNDVNKQGFCLKLDQSLNIVWEKHLDVPLSNLYTRDYDVASFVTPTDQGYFITGGKNILNVLGQQKQGVMAIMLDPFGNQIWDASYVTGNFADNGASAFYDQPTQQIYVLTNISVTHHFGISIFDANTGALDNAQSFRAYTNNGDLEKYGHTIIKTPFSNKLLIQGRGNDSQWANNNNLGQPAFLVDYDLSTQQFGVHYSETNSSNAFSNYTTESPFPMSSFRLYYNAQSLVNIDAHHSAMISYQGDTGDELSLVVRKFSHISPDQYEFCNQGYVFELDATDPTGSVPGDPFTNSPATSVPLPVSFTILEEETLDDLLCYVPKELPLTKTFDLNHQIEDDTSLDLMDLGVQVLENKNGEYITFGHSQNSVSNELEFTFTRHATDGSISTNPVLLSHASTDLLQVVKALEVCDATGNTAGYLVLFLEDGTLDKVFLAKLDPTGTPLWLEQIELDNSTVNEATPYDMILHDDLAVITGGAKVGSITKTFITTYNHVTQNAGCTNILDIDPITGQSHQGMALVHRDDDSHYGIAGLHGNDLIYFEVEYDCLFASFNINWRPWIDNDSSTKDIPVDIIVNGTPNQIYIVGYQEGSNRFFVTYGNFCNFYEASTGDVVLKKALLGSNNQDIVVGGELYNNGVHTGFLAGIDVSQIITPANSLSWSNEYNDVEYPQTSVFDVSVTSDDGYLITGYGIHQSDPNTGFFSFAYYDTWIAKTDTNGQLGDCDCSSPLAWNYGGGGGTGSSIIFDFLTTATDNASLFASSILNHQEYVCDRYCPILPPDPICEGNLVQNGDFEQGAPTNGDEDISNATSWGAIWTPTFGFSSADFYNTSMSLPGGNATPLPSSQGNFGSMWCAYTSSQIFREGMMNELISTIAPNSGSYELSFKVACLGGYSNTPTLSIWGVTAPGIGSGNSPTAFNLPLNSGFFGPANSLNIANYAFPTTCDENFTTLTFTFNSNNAGFPAGGLSHLFFTRADGIPGLVYIALDDVCLRELPCCVNENVFVDAVEEGFSYDVSGNTVQVGNELLSACNNLTIDWNDGHVDEISATQLPFSHTYEGNNDTEFDICIEVTEDNGEGGACFQEDHCEVITSSNDITNNLALQLYPNPTTGIITLELDKMVDLGQIEVFDLQGKLVHFQPERLAAQIFELNLNHLPNGVYIVQAISNESEILMGRVIKQ